MKSIDISDLAKTYRNTMIDAYATMTVEAAKRVMDDCNKLVADGLRGEKLQQLVDTTVKNVADALCAAEGKVDDETGEPLEKDADGARHYLLDKLANVSEELSADGGVWIVTGKANARCLAFVEDTDE